MCAILSGAVTSPAFAQTSPSPVLNNQLNLGEIFSEQTLNVQTVSDGVTAATCSRVSFLSTTEATVAVRQFSTKLGE